MSNKILIVEDNTQNMYMMNYLLSKNGFQVIQASNGFSALEKARNESPDLILLDLQLPDMSGYDVASELTTNSPRLHIPILAVSSHSQPSYQQKALASGCVGYIEKPINPDTFISEIKKFLALRGAK